jgi:hypothetical protein
MTAQDITVKAYEEKVKATLQQIRAQISELDSRARGKAAQGEIDAIQRLKSKQHELESKHAQLKGLAEAKLEQHKAEIDAEVTRVKASLAELAAKLKVEGQRKAG